MRRRAGRVSGCRTGRPRPSSSGFSRATSAALAAATVRARIEALGYSPFASSPAEFRQHIADETAKWGKVIRTAGIHLN